MRTEPATAPQALGIPSRALLDLIDALERQGLDPHALVVSRRTDHGWQDAVSCAWHPFDTHQPALVYSVSKTFTSLAIGLLIDEGRLTVEDSVGELLGLADLHGLTVKHLLTMNTGHSPEQIDALEFRVRELLSVPPAASPGTRFAYNSDATYALSCIVTALTGERLTDYLRPRLLDPLGIERRWMKAARGVEQGFSGFHITVGEIARVAQLLADDGRWDGRQLVSAEYVADLAHAWSDTRDPAKPEGVVDDWGLGYGYQVWRSSHGFRLDGAYGQFGLVIPEKDLVIAYQGATTTTQPTLDAIWRFVEAIDTVVELDADAAADDVGEVGARLAALDTWSFRDTLTVDRNVAVDTGGWSLTERDGGWTLDIPSFGAVTVGELGWARTIIATPGRTDPTDGVVDSPPVEAGTQVVVEARGAPDADVLIHLVVPTSPHRLIVRVDGAGTIDAGWHTVPLEGGTPATFAVPEWVIR